MKIAQEKHDRECNSCGASYPLPLNAFVKEPESKYNRRNACKRCWNNRLGDWRSARLSLHRWFLKGLKFGPCSDCGFWPEHPCQMDFDHVFGEKSYNVANTIKLSIKTILLEVSKCQLVCANCHRLRTNVHCK